MFNEAGFGKNDDILPEQHLWREVLHQALKDAINGQSSMSARLHREEALSWIYRAFRGRNRSFVMICDLAGMEINYVIKIFRRELKKRKLI
jgi:hypothetical protein